MVTEPCSACFGPRVLSRKRIFCCFYTYLRVSLAIYNYLAPRVIGVCIGPTTIASAQKLGRKWIGIDITHLSIALQKYRMEAMFPGIKFKVIGEPKDIGAARQLASEDRYQFQWWSLSLI